MELNVRKTANWASRYATMRVKRLLNEHRRSFQLGNRTGQARYRRSPRVGFDRARRDLAVRIGRTWPNLPSRALACRSQPRRLGSGDRPIRGCPEFDRTDARSAA